MDSENSENDKDMRNMYQYDNENNAIFDIGWKDARKQVFIV